MSEPDSVARLRRAATLLRARVGALPPGVRDSPWATYNTDKPYAPSYVMARVDTGDVLLAKVQWGPGAVEAEHIAGAANPATVLALAAWLDAEAKREAHSLAEFGYRVVPNEAHELARLVLREDEGSEG